MSLAPGVGLGAHRVVALMGAGGMGEVHPPRDTQLDLQVAVRALPATVVINCMGLLKQ